MTSSTPVDQSVDVALNGSVTATFSEAMDPATLDGSTFTLTAAGSTTPIPGTVIYADQTLVFWPSAHLTSGASFTATISTGAESAHGIALADDFAWTFDTGSRLDPGQGVALRNAGNFVILAKTGISTVPTAAVTGDLGVSPAAASYITGFDLSADATNVFSMSSQVTGKVYAANYAVPTPSNLTTAVGDMQLAFTDAAGRAPDVTELHAGDLGGLNLAPGVYKWGTGVTIPTDVHLTGTTTDVWIFQIAQGLTVASDTSVILDGGLAKNVVWQVSGGVTVGARSHLEGIVLGQTSISLETGASINGRLLAQTAVDIAGSTVVAPAP